MIIEIFFKNLDKTKHDELLKAAGVSTPEEMNWDAFPVADIEIEPENGETTNDP